MGSKRRTVYSEADRDALHTKARTEAYYIGKSRVSESYLNIERIIEVAKKANADAIHPGYGLLSENSRFAQRRKEENIVFIGPSPAVIAKMGSKIEARKAMEEAGVPVVPGVSESLGDIQATCLAASEIGYPVMLKASAGEAASECGSFLTKKH